MIERIIILSLIETAIHVCTWDGMIFNKLATEFGEFLDSVHLSVLRKPVFECNICMGGLWTLILYPPIYGITWAIVPTMLAVIGMNSLIAAVLKYLQQ